MKKTSHKKTYGADIQKNRKKRGDKLWSPLVPVTDPDFATLARDVFLIQIIQKH